MDDKKPDWVPELPDIFLPVLGPKYTFHPMMASEMCIWNGDSTSVHYDNSDKTWSFGPHEIGWHEDPADALADYISHVLKTGKKR